jgi:hypothetical protein
MGTYHHSCASVDNSKKRKVVEYRRGGAKLKSSQAAEEDSKSPWLDILQPGLTLRIEPVCAVR